MTAKLLTPTKQVRVNGETLTIAPFGFGQLPLVAELVDEITTKLNGEQIDFMKILANGGESLMQLLSLATGKDREWFDEITDYSEAVELISAVFELNKEQFIKNLLPALATVLPGAGLKSQSTLTQNRAARRASRSNKSQRA